MIDQDLVSLVFGVLAAAALACFVAAGVCDYRRTKEVKPGVEPPPPSSGAHNFLAAMGFAKVDVSHLTEAGQAYVRRYAQFLRLGVLLFGAAVIFALFSCSLLTTCA